MTSSRETLLLRGASAADAVPYLRSPQGAPVWGRRAAPPPPVEDAAPPVTVAPPEVPVPRQPRPAGPTPAHHPPPAAGPRPRQPRPAVPTPAPHLPPAAASAAGGTTKAAGVTRADAAGMRLGEVYAEQLARLRAEARREGWAAGHAEGLVAAEQVVAAAERAAEERLAAVQARWERRLAPAPAAMGGGAA